jgi:hypothetical protein
MPFRSKQQSKACFATGGFGGKVDCREWAKHTNYSKLKNRAGGSSFGHRLRRKNNRYD